MQERASFHIGVLLLRLGFAGSMLTHGIPKMMKLFGPGPIEFSDPLGVGATASLTLAVIGEVVAPALIIVGFKTRLAVIPAVFTMIVAAFVVLGDDPFKRKELAILYLLAFVVIGIMGPGKYSVDKKNWGLGIRN